MKNIGLVASENIRIIMKREISECNLSRKIMLSACRLF